MGSKYAILIKDKYALAKNKKQKNMIPNFIYAPFVIKSVKRFNCPKKPAKGGNPINENILIKRTDYGNVVQKR